MGPAGHYEPMTVFPIFFSIYHAQMKQKLNLGMNYHEFLLYEKYNSNYSN